VSRFIAIDWDHGQVHIVSAQVGKGGVQIQRALVLPEERVPNPAQAEELGQWLREQLKVAGIGPAPVIFCVGRDRTILRELRYPPVPAHEEPAVVRFQITKELHDSPDDVVIDYLPLPEANGNGHGEGERRALTVILRKELLQAYRTLCKSAGLRLAGVTPRALGTAACLRGLMGRSPLTPPPEPADAPVAAIVIAGGWAEYCVMRGENLLFSRALPVGEDLAAEVQRNVRVFAGQSQRQPIQALYVGGGVEHAELRRTLQDLVDLQVYSFDPLQGARKEDVSEGGHGSFAGAAGLLYAQSQRRGLGINFVEPRQPRAPINPNRRTIAIGALAAVFVLFAIGALLFYLYMGMERTKRQLKQELTELDDRIESLQTDAKNRDAVFDWLTSNADWLDEFYDVTVLMPDNEKINVTQFRGDPARAVATLKDKNKSSKEEKFVGLVTIKGKAKDKKLLDDWRKELKKDPTYNVAVFDDTQTSDGKEREFTIVIDLRKRDLTGYSRKLSPVKREGSGTGGTE
jgi:Tfp pilus assembly PilM family ATPase